MRESSDGMASSIWLFSQEAHRSGAMHSGAGTPSIVCSAAFASSTARARPTSDKPRGDNEMSRFVSEGTVDSGKMSGPTASSS